MNIDIIKSLGLSDEEEKFIEAAETSITAEMNQSRIISEIYFVKKLEDVADKTVASNEKLSKSNEKYAKGMVILTAGLVSVGILQIILIILT